MDDGIYYNGKVCIDLIQFDNEGHLMLDLTQGSKGHGPVIEANISN